MNVRTLRHYAHYIPRCAIHLPRTPHTAALLRLLPQRTFSYATCRRCGVRSLKVAGGRPATRGDIHTASNTCLRRTMLLKIYRVVAFACVGQAYLPLWFTYARPPIHYAPAPTPWPTRIPAHHSTTISHRRTCSTISPRLPATSTVRAAAPSLHAPPALGSSRLVSIRQPVAISPLAKT